MAKRYAVGEGAVHRPAGRRTGRRDHQRDFERNDGIVFEAAEFLWPAGAEQFRVTDLGDDMWRDRAVALGLLGQFPDFGDHVASPLDQLLWRRRRFAAKGGAHRWPLRSNLQVRVRRGLARKAG